MRREKEGIEAFGELVALKYRLYNGLFLGLPFKDLADTGVLLPLFAQTCRDRLAEGHSPRRIVTDFFRDRPGHADFAGRMRTLFKFVQLVERQVVLFDALEDAAFESVNDMDGPGTLSHLLSRLENEGLRRAFRDKLEDYRIRVVLTAHPTQFYPNAVLWILSDLCEAVGGNRLDRILDLLLQMGKTRFGQRKRPTPLDEAGSLVWYLENVFYPTLPAIQGDLCAARSGDAGDPFSLSPKLELGFWPGGDRDGNPYVTAGVTLRVAHMLRASIQRLYAEDLRTLERRLTFDGVAQRLAGMRLRLCAGLGPQEARAPLPSAVLSAGRQGPERPYEGAGEMLEDLRELRRELVERHQGLFLGLVDGFIHKVSLFGFHFAAIDLRQDSGSHARALDTLLPDYAGRKSLPAEFAGKRGSYLRLAADGKRGLLERLLALPRTAWRERHSPQDPEAAETLESFRAARDIQRVNGTRGLNRYVVSHTAAAHNVLEVMALAALSGWPPEALDLDIVPLFETIGDLRRAGEVMAALYASRPYRRHLERRGFCQTVMLGFSDGTKDGGYLAANWAIYNAKREITRVSREAGVKAIFFDGRGGPPARGGGNTHKFYRSLGRDIEHTEIQLTIQGQTITSNFGTPASARFNLEQLFTAGLEPDLFPNRESSLDPESAALLERLAQEGGKAYAALKSHPRFLSYLEEAAPLDYFNRLNIASRPARRRSGGPRRFEDLRAIPFVSAWSQMKQNVPGYYGFGAALEAVVASGGEQPLRDLYRESLFFRTLAENAMMSLSKSYFPLTRYLERDARFGRFWGLLRDEADRTRNLLLSITGQEELLESSPVVRESIRIRESIVLPILAVQQYAMQEVRSLKKRLEKAGANRRSNLEERVAVLEKLILRAMPANINASRNSA